MSETDYQRGLRGGGCNVSIGDTERYLDWAAGRDERARRLEAEDEERIMQVLTPAEQIARIDTHRKQREAEEEKELVSAKTLAGERIQRREHDRRVDKFSLLVTVIFAVGAGCIAGLIVGGVLLIFGVPFVLGFGATLILVSYIAIQHDVRIDAEKEKDRIKEDERDKELLR